MVEPAPAARRPLWLVPVLVLAVGVVLLVVIVGGYFVAGAAIARSEDRQAVATLESARKHNNQIYDSLKAPQLPRSLSSAADISKAREVVNGYLSTLSEADKTLDSDLKSLKDEDSRLAGDQRNILVLPERSKLAADRERVAGMISAFTNAKTGFKILQTLVPVMQAMIDVVEGLNALKPLLNNQDWQGAINVLNQVNPKLQNLLTLANGPNLPPEFALSVKLLNRFADDFKSLLQAIVAKDFATAQSLAPRVDADEKALNLVDLSGMDAYEDNLLKPYRDAYEAGLRKAGFTVTG
jgi:hypothetical protein